MPKSFMGLIITSSGTINTVVDNKAYTVSRDHPSYGQLKEAVTRNDAEAFVRLADVPQAVKSWSGEEIEVRDGVVFYKGQPLHNNLTERAMGLMRDGFPFEPMLKFLVHLKANPSFRAQNELYPFLEHKGLPVTEDGCFLGYKAVKGNYTDKYSGNFDNHVGTVHEIPRNEVDEDWRTACSSGFHVGSLEYVRTFSNDADDHIMIVKVNPRDVVSVPAKEETKLRTCKYEVVGEYDRNLLMDGVHMSETLHSAAGKPLDAPSGNGGYGYDEDEEEEDDEYDDSPLYDEDDDDEEDEDEDFDDDDDDGDDD